MQAYNIKNARRKIWAGSFVVYLILTVSLGVSIAYWYILAGASNTEDQTIFWTFIIWLVVAVGFTAEIIKKVTISLFRNLSIWGVATFVSILTVMGTYSILDNDKQNELTKQSDGYQLAKNQKTEALKQQAKFAYAQPFKIDELEKQKQRAAKKGYWGTFNRLKKDIEAKRNYISATNTLNLSSQTMNIGGAGTVSSNPFLTNLAKPFGISGELLKSLFFLLVTLLLEIGAYWIGGRVEELKQTLTLTEAEILDLKLFSMYGVTMQELNTDLFSNVLKAQINHIQAEKEIEDIRKTSRKKLPAGEASQQINQIKKEDEEQQAHAKKPNHPISDFPLQTAPTVRANIQPFFSPKSPQNPAKNRPSNGFGFLSDIAPKRGQTAPKKGQGAESTAPKRGQLKTVTHRTRSSGVTGGKRKKETPDTGTTGANAHRYRALVDSIKTGETKPTYRGIRSFKYGGRGMGTSTVKIYMEALKKEGIIS